MAVEAQTATVQALAAYTPANAETFQGEFCGIRP